MARKPKIVKNKRKNITLGKVKPYRSVKQREKDYHKIHKLLNKGYTWVEIHAWFFNNREYSLSLERLRRDYYNITKKIKEERSIDFSIDRHLDDLEAIQKKCLDAWLKSCSDKKSSERKYKKVLLKSSKKKNIKKPAYIIEETVKVLESEGNPKFLELFLKATDRIVKLTKPPEPKTPLVNNNFNFSINEKNKDDNFDNVNAKVISSEEDLKEVEEEIPLKFKDILNKFIEKESESIEDIDDENLFN